LVYDRLFFNNSRIPLDKVKKAREEIENLTPWDEGLVEMYDVLEIIDKLIEEYESEE